MTFGSLTRTAPAPSGAGPRTRPGPPRRGWSARAVVLALALALGLSLPGAPSCGAGAGPARDAAAADAPADGWARDTAPDGDGAPGDAGGGDVPLPAAPDAGDGAGRDVPVGAPDAAGGRAAGDGDGGSGDAGCAAPCDDADPCTDDRCGPAGACVHEPLGGCCPLTPLWQTGFEAAEGVVVAVVDRAGDARPDWFPGDRPVVWRTAAGAGADGSAALVFGDEARGSFDNGRRVAAAARLPAVALPAGLRAELRFAAWRDTERRDEADRLFVEVEVDGARVPLWTAPPEGADRAWRWARVELTAFAGRTVRPIFVFDSVDGSANGGEGVRVDDVAVGTRCEPAACAADADCDDGAACTSEVCAAGRCAATFDPAGGCCAEPVHCWDGDACTYDRCEDGACAPLPLPDPAPPQQCCTGDADCLAPDSDPCAAAWCDAGTCRALPSGAPGCCAADADCAGPLPCLAGTCGADGACAVASACECRAAADCADPHGDCTRDRCVDGRCAWEATGAAGCCAPTVYATDFADDDAAAGWTFANENAAVGWSVAPCPLTGSGALYYGHPAFGTYDAGGLRTAGTTLSPPLRLPAAAEVTLTFGALLGVEPGAAYDVLRVDLLHGAARRAVPLWRKDPSTPAYTALRPTFDVSGFAGESVLLRFVFDTVDGEGNAREGVCIDDVTVTSSCRTRPCGGDAACDDGSGATADACVGGVCRHVPGAAPCVADGDCDDRNPCTEDTCSPAGCGYREVQGCCLSDAACDDGDPCTRDACAAATLACAHDRVPDCCTGAEDCADGDPCTADTCPQAGAFCVFEPLAACCRAAAECDDGDACTRDRCVAATCERTPACCATAADCVGADACGRAECAGAECVYRPVEGEACCERSVVLADFEGGSADGFESTGNGVGDDRWEARCSPFDGTCALAYGRPGAGGGYSFDSAGTAWSPPIELPEGQELELSLRARLSAAITAELRILLDAGPRTWELARWPGNDGRGEWQRVSFDATPFAGQTVRLRVTFTAGPAAAYEGAAIDDVTLSGSCAPRACENDAACAPDDPCTVGRCLAGGCEYAPVPGCCTRSADCDDGDPCTADTCLAGACRREPLADCCAAAADCDDGDPCTVDACAGGRCAHECAAGCPACCAAAADCDDGDPCTADRCAARACEHEAACCRSAGDCDDGDPCTTDRCESDECAYRFHAEGAGCCDDGAALWAVDFEDGAPGGFVDRGGGAEGDRWQVVAAADGEPVHGGAYALGYGRPGGYAPESRGVAVGPPVDLPPHRPLTLSLWLRTDTEGGADTVALSLVGADGGLDLGLYSGTGAWREIARDVSALAGQRVRLRAAFASDTSAERGGVWLDDVRLAVDCARPPCADAADCAAPAPCFDAECRAGACAYAPAAPGCCTAHSVCEDGDPCTDDACEAGTCVARASLLRRGCCATDADCDDGVACAPERCVAGRCRRVCPADCAAPLPWSAAFTTAGSLGDACWTTRRAPAHAPGSWDLGDEVLGGAGPHLVFVDWGAAGPPPPWEHCALSPPLAGAPDTAPVLRFRHVAPPVTVGAFTVAVRVLHADGAEESVWSRAPAAAAEDVTVPLAPAAGAASFRLAFCVSVPGTVLGSVEWEVDAVRVEAAE